MCMDHITFQKVLKQEFTILTNRKNGLGHICCHKVNGAKSQFDGFCKIFILYGRKCKSEWSSRWSDLLSMLRATECLHAAHLDLRPIPALTPAVFAGVRTVLTEPSGSLLGAETVVQNFSTQLLMVLKSGNSACLRLPNFLCVTMIFFQTALCPRLSGDLNTDSLVPSWRL